MSSAVWPYIPRIWRRRGVKRLEPGVLEITASPRAATWLGRTWSVLKRNLLGHPFRSDAEHEQRLTKTNALALIGSDSIASSVYGPESMLRTLVFAAGIGALSHSLLLSLGILVLLTIVALSYRQTIAAYPTGGGSYTVSKDNFGVKLGLVAGVALMIDYILNVAVSVAAGIESVTSLFPNLLAHKVALCLIAIVLLMVGNLRGNRSSALLFAGPVYLYILGAFTVIGIGLYKWASGSLPMYVPTPVDLSHVGPVGVTVSAAVLLRAFASGAVALSGVEAMSNGVPAFRTPETTNAKQTLTWMAVLFGGLFVGFVFLAGKMGVVPDPREAETLISRIARTAMGGTEPFYWLIQSATALMLIIAANTSYADFPRLANVMAQDRFLPERFSWRGPRLAFSTGIVFLSVVAGILVIIFRGSLAALVPLFTIGVFISFTMSEAGMVHHHWRRRDPGWRRGLVINGLGALVTGAVALLEAVTKFEHGAWVILVLIPALVLFLTRVRHHFRVYDDKMTVKDAYATHPATLARDLRHHVLIPVESLNRADLFALGYVRSLVNEKVKRIEAVHISHDRKQAEKLREDWERAELGVPLVVLNSPYRGLVEPLVTYVEMLRRDQEVIVDVFVPEPVPKHFWQQFLHKKTTWVLKAMLMLRPGITVMTVPYHLL